MTVINQKELKKRLRYDPTTGIFTWLVSNSNCVKVGSVSGTRHKYGYIQINIMYKIYKAHRLAYLYMTGEWPTKDIDHINQIKDDNRWSNLRECTRSQNMANTVNRSDNTSGYKGVIKWRKKWLARTHLNGKQIHIGVFNCKHEAAKAYNKKALEIFGEFSFLNKIATV